mmetsp:Transcript_83628/g.224180  ORF Transcript_83628/g.224180 Transcript_83628/m.224180 type:complete len:249 (+) Transcript_83628:1-747(+)
MCPCAPRRRGDGGGLGRGAAAKAADVPGVQPQDAQLLQRQDAAALRHEDRCPQAVPRRAQAGGSLPGRGLEGPQGAQRLRRPHRGHVGREEHRVARRARGPLWRRGLGLGGLGRPARPQRLVRRHGEALGPRRPQEPEDHGAARRTSVCRGRGLGRDASGKRSPRQRCEGLGPEHGRLRPNLDRTRRARVDVQRRRGGQACPQRLLRPPPRDVGPSERPRCEGHDPPLQAGHRRLGRLGHVPGYERVD